MSFSSFCGLYHYNKKVLLIKIFTEFFLNFFFYFYTSNIQGLTIQHYKNKKNSKIQVQNKAQTLNKSYSFLSKACTRREHININSNNDNNNNNNNNNKTNKQTNNIYIYIYIYIYKNKNKK